VRERASLLLRESLDICKTRDDDPTPNFETIFTEAKSVLQKGGSTDSILGSMLAFGAMLQNTHIVRVSMRIVTDLRQWPISSSQSAKLY